MKFVCWNINSLKVRKQQLLDLLAQHDPDVVGLQETKMQDGHFPQQAFEELGYHIIYSGQKTYNGVALLSKQVGGDACYNLSKDEDDQKRFIAWTVNNVRVINVYVPNGSEIGSEKFEYKLNWLEELRHYIQEQMQIYDHLLVMGDFNIAPEDRDVHDPEKWRGKVLFSDVERQALQQLLNLGLDDAFRLYNADTGYYSWWDYRRAAFRRDHGLRIDLMLTSPALSALCQSVIIDLPTRRLERPSDHAPVILETL